MRPSLDALLIDAIHPGEIVFIDDTPHRFLKRTNNSDYVFFLPQTDEVVCYDTTKLVTLQAEQRYYRPGTDRPAFPTEKSNASHEMAAAIHKRAFLSFCPNARERARARWRYVSRFLNEMRLAEAKARHSPDRTKTPYGLLTPLIKRSMTKTPLRVILHATSKSRDVDPRVRYFGGSHA